MPCGWYQQTVKPASYVIDNALITKQMAIVSVVQGNVQLTNESSVVTQGLWGQMTCLNQYQFGWFTVTAKILVSCCDGMQRSVQNKYFDR